ncbi:MAG: hypothetical protein HQL95_10135 [Magnetococcales bacterium]|nr:hypothetical protein [Magnetococcales bacterium]
MQTYLKIFLSITGAFGILHVLSLFIFMVNPQFFYFRAWEYFTDLVYTGQVPPVWNGTEWEDLTRNHFFYYQASRHTTVTTDGDGFRITAKQPAARYPVLMTGDSNIFGSGLSDQETLPWQLSEQLGIPVFNGSRSSLGNVLKRQELQQVRLVIECLIERNLSNSSNPANQTMTTTDGYQPITRHDKGYLEILTNIPVNRYSLPHRATALFKRFQADWKVFRKGGAEPYSIMRYTLHPEELTRDVAQVVARQATLQQMGIAYIFVPIPSKQRLYADNLDEFTREYTNRFIDQLRKRDITTIDLVTPMLAHKDEGLFFRHDTHWNEKGAALAAQVIAREVRTVQPPLE